MNTNDIAKAIKNHISKRSDFLVLTENLSWELAFEADVLMVTKDFEVIEYEIKSSRGDFLKDSKKKTEKGVFKYEFLNGEKIIHSFYQEKRPNKFFYVAPHGMIRKSELHKNFGLIEILPSGQVVTSKHAKKLHQKKTTINFALSIARNFCLKNCKK